MRLGKEPKANNVVGCPVVFKHPQAKKFARKNVPRGPAIKTCFMSTCALMQKGASVTFDQRALKIVHKERCVAIGYLKHNLYWLDAEGISLNAHTGGAATSLHT